MTPAKTGRPESSPEAAVRIRRAGPGDLGPVEGLLKSEGLPLQGVEEHLPSFVVAQARGRIVGVAGLERYGPDALLRSVAVEAPLRGRGLGSRLTDAVLEGAREEGVRRIYLLTTTAAGFFPRHGFEEIGREDVPAGVRESVEFREACPDSATVMVRDPA